VELTENSMSRFSAILSMGLARNSFLDQAYLGWSLGGTRNYWRYLKAELRQQNGEVVRVTTQLEPLALAASKDPEPR
jgi:hypothetical protein